MEKLAPLAGEMRCAVRAFFLGLKRQISRKTLPHGLVLVFRHIYGSTLRITCGLSYFCKPQEQAGWSG
eukprot:scaffold206981_cov16-Tisochrysis_lutea.AAC.2